MINRRHFLSQTAATFSLAAATSSLMPAWGDQPASGGEGSLPFKISLAEWSLHRLLQDEKSGKTNLDFPAITRDEFGIEAVEYVNQFFMDKAKDEKYLADLNKRCADAGVKSLLIMVDREGNLGDPDEKLRAEAIEKHRKWLEAAATLGCHSIRVNAASDGTYDEQLSYATDGLARLSEIAKPMNLNVIVENHGGLSSNGSWLSSVIAKVAMPNCGTLPDFGNFYITRGDKPELYDRYQGVEELMPFAKAVSAKTHAFDAEGNETETDYVKMMEIVLHYGYKGYVGIEYEGGQVDEFTGIRKTRDLLIKVGKQLSAKPS
jgi:L-ribulose-5-phosphate 3-epimerase